MQGIPLGGYLAMVLATVNMYCLVIAMSRILCAAAQSPVAQLPGILGGHNDEGDGAVIPETQVDDEEGGSVPCTQVEEPESCAPHEPSSERKKKKKNKSKKRKLEAGE